MDLEDNHCDHASLYPQGMGTDKVLHNHSQDENSDYMMKRGLALQ